MKKILLLLTICLIATSCIQKEALNAEADIVACIVDENILKREPIIRNDKITLMVKGNTNLTRQAPEFTLTEGASIEPAGGTQRDFTTPQTYTVTSEDRQWKKEYTVSYIPDELSTLYHFEDTIPEKDNKYYIFAEKNNGSVTMEWASGNTGFAIIATAMHLSPGDYPTARSDDGYIGKCALLTTRSTGTLGSLFKMPIAAGNLFIGTFETDLSDPLKSTKFGLPFHYIPATFSGYYKYKAGDTYYENGNAAEGIKDNCHFYAVLYETDETASTLDGTNILTHPNIISAAIVEDQTETDEWIRFDLPFVYRPGKSIDPEKLKNGKYNLAVVFTSSIDGGLFKGAPGSTLYIDEVEITLASGTDYDSTID